MQAQSLHFLIYNDLFVLKREHEAMLGQYLVDVGRPRMPGGPRASAPCLGAPAAPNTPASPAGRLSLGLAAPNPARASTSGPEPAAMMSA